MSAERQSECAAPIEGQDVLPFRSPEVLYALYKEFETAIQSLAKKEPILQNRAMFALRIHRMMNAELLTEIRRWQKGPHDAYADEIPA